MPIDFDINKPSDKESTKFLLPEGEYTAKVLDLEDAGFSPFQPGKKQIKFTFVVKHEEEDHNLLVWAINTWWFGEPAPSKLYRIYKAVGMVDSSNEEPSDPNAIIGKPIGVEVVHKKDKDGTPRARIRDFYKVITTKEK